MTMKAWSCLTDAQNLYARSLRRQFRGYPSLCAVLASGDPDLLRGDSEGRLAELSELRAVLEDRRYCVEFISGYCRGTLNRPNA